MHTYRAEWLDKCFWPKVKEDPDTGCWDWIGNNNQGYGSTVYEKKTLRTHRVSWEVVNGPIPTDKILMHSCDNRRCCNPQHLSLGTHRENFYDSVRKGRNPHSAPKPFCPRGHPSTPENRAPKKGGGTVCVPCRKARSAEWYARLRADAAKGRAL